MVCGGIAKDGLRVYGIRFRTLRLYGFKVSGSKVYRVGPGRVPDACSMLTRKLLRDQSNPPTSAADTQRIATI